MLKPTRVNEIGFAYLTAWIETTAAADEAGLLQNTDAKALDAWACDAEEAMASGNPAMVEMPGNATKSGVPETFTIPADGLHWEDVETQTEAAEKLRKAIYAYKGDTGPICWSVSEVTDGETIRLVATYPADYQLTDEPWNKFGGYDILAIAGFSSHNGGMDAYQDGYGENMVCQWADAS
jgi:hypothetical protein